MASSQDPLGRSDPICSGAGGDLPKEDRVPYRAPGNPVNPGEMDLLCRDEVGQMEVEDDVTTCVRPTEVTNRLRDWELETLGTRGPASAQGVLRRLVSRDGIPRPDDLTPVGYRLPPEVTRLTAEDAPRRIDPVIRRAIELYLLTDESKNFPEKWFLYWDEMQRALQICWPLRQAVLSVEQYMREHGVSRNDTILVSIDEALRPATTWSDGRRGMPGVRPLGVANQGHDQQRGKARPTHENPKGGLMAVEDNRQDEGNGRGGTMEPPDSIPAPIRVGDPSKERVVQPPAGEKDTLFWFEQEDPLRRASETESVLPAPVKGLDPGICTDSMVTAPPAPIIPMDSVPPEPARPVGFYPCLRLRAMNLRFQRCFGIPFYQWDGTRKQAMALLRKKEDPGEG